MSSLSTKPALMDRVFHRRSVDESQLKELLDQCYSEKIARRALRHAEGEMEKDDRMCKVCIEMRVDAVKGAEKEKNMDRIHGTYETMIPYARVHGVTAPTAAGGHGLDPNWYKTDRWQ
ncbi:uncharacterized protein EHS24_000083 [Apiotrichum porosum]|uniref:Uncharacterized protein n=1 Tax=Apiotrichum porosum TaxID=105984 RepID=A0A427Y8X4_9TREE|nr:uncharacterized protein EHS24_000083 [Apiotrichum porosum]RSH87572.1 hypothetical protein EHS24_000083 [Apiotrichum porosum]